MTRAERVELILHPGIVAIVRTNSDTPLEPLAEALYEGGIRAIEATLTTPGAIDSIRRLGSSVKTGMAVGVGTVLDRHDASEAIEAGADFVVTPVVRPRVVEACLEAGVTVACGAFTPTEALAAHEAGADFVKIFPADVGGPSYIRSLLAPLPMLRIIPTGGLTPENCRAFLDAGAVALGAGSRLVSNRIVAERDWRALTIRAREFVSAVASSA